MPSYKCNICDTEDPGFAWADTHGVAQCRTCGAPVRILHYGDGGKRIEKEPTPMMVEQEELARQCWQATGARFSAVGLHISMPGGYDVATADEAKAVADWWNTHIPKEAGDA